MGIIRGKGERQRKHAEDRMINEGDNEGAQQQTPLYFRINVFTFKFPIFRHRSRVVSSAHFYLFLLPTGALAGPWNPKGFHGPTHTGREQKGFPVLISSARGSVWVHGGLNPTQHTTSSAGDQDSLTSTEPDTATRNCEFAST